MNDTKENILAAALELFSKNGYEAVSVSEIAGKLGITKGALYKHYTNKRDIFGSILARMEQLDTQRAQQYELPAGTLTEMGDAYHKASIQQLISFSRSQFRYWTEEPFPASFRKMLTLEQYHSEEMRSLYQQYLVSGPLGYVTDLFLSWNVPNAHQKAVELYAPMFFYYSMYDGAADPAAASKALDAHMESVRTEWEKREKEAK